MKPNKLNHNLTNWDIFVLRHRKPLNWVIHFISLLCFYLSPPAALITHRWEYLVLFFGSGALGAFGHFISGDGGVSLRETTSTPRVVLFVPIMFFRILSGRYSADLRIADEKLRNFNESLRA